MEGETAARIQRDLTLIGDESRRIENGWPLRTFAACNSVLRRQGVNSLAGSWEVRLTSKDAELFLKLKESAALRLPFHPSLLQTNFVGTSWARLVCVHLELPAGRF